MQPRQESGIRLDLNSIEVSNMSRSDDDSSKSVSSSSKNSLRVEELFTEEDGVAPASHAKEERKQSRMSKSRPSRLSSVRSNSTSRSKKYNSPQIRDSNRTESANRAQVAQDS